MLIRPETPADYPAVADINLKAFGYRAAEMLVVALLRQRDEYDPELALVAVENGKIVGHAFFSRYMVRVLNQSVPAVNLAPLAVDPAYQKQGIGKALMAEGHRIAREKGAALTFLLGHPTYYPRVGYQTHAFGAASLKINTAGLSAAGIEVRALHEQDIPALHDVWRHELNGVDFSVEPDRNLSDWFSPNPLFQAQVYRQDGQIVGYTRGKSGDIRLFLAADADAARAMAAYLAGDAGEITLPLHPYAASFAAFAGTVSCQAWEAGMALSLSANPFDDYRAKVQRGERLPGAPLWGTAFDVA